MTPSSLREGRRLLMVDLLVTRARPAIAGQMADGDLRSRFKTTWRARLAPLPSV
jgi:hypothetical protein